MSPKQRWTGRALSGLALLFLAFDASMKFLNLPVVIQANAQLGYPTSLIPVIGAIEIVCVAISLVPRTAVLGAVLCTGYLGGALASHLRVGDSLLGQVLFPTYVAALLWGGLWLRDTRVRTMLSSGAAPDARRDYAVTTHS